MNAVERMIAVSSARRCTQLGIGPMSELCTVAVVELATSLRLPLMLIASRRQIECEEFGGGYVNGWHTRSFAEYVRQRDPSGFVLLCRDHGGPWQGNHEVRRKMGLTEAMEAAKYSFAEDITAGFQILHIDPSVNLQGTPTQREIVDRVKELLVFCHTTATTLGKTVYYEFGKEEQGTDIEGEESFLEFLEEMVEFARVEKMPRPLFVVGQTGTKVLERRNIGTFGEHFRREGLIPPEIQIPKLVDACRRYGVFLKAHNVDYLSDEDIRWHPQLGIHAANVAPEFGVGETLHLLAICEELGLHREAEEFLAMAYASRKWEKWLLPHSTSDDRERGILAGHYVFGTPAFKTWKERLKCLCHVRNVDLDVCLKEKIKQLVYRYLLNLNLVRS